MTSTPSQLLLIDDDPILVEAYARLLTGLGYAVTTAMTGDAAAQLLARERFDVVITDVELPGIEGTELISTVRLIDPDIPVVVITGHPTFDTAARAVELRAFRYLLKPIDPGRLAETVRAALVELDAARRQRKLAAQLDRPKAELIEAPFELALGGLWVALQPIVALDSRSTYAWEALMRTTATGLARPDEILAAATALGRMPELARAMRRLTATVARDLRRNTSLFVNLHPVDLLDPLLYEDAEPLAEYADRYVLELTERADLDTIPDLDDRLARLRKRGYRIAIDDLGAGYAGLTALARVKPDVVKLDMSLVRNVDSNPTQRAVVRSLTDLCANLDLKLVAEGIETPGERDTLKVMGINLMQGYHFGRPGRGFGVPHFDATSITEV